jgi:hypothetical protein
VIRLSTIFALAAMLLACGSDMQTAGGKPSPTPVTPREATLTITGEFTAFKNQYGDPLDSLKLHIASNVPVAFKVQIHFSKFQAVPGGPTSVLLHDGKADDECTHNDGCLVSPGATSLDDFYCNQSCPSGTYVFEAWVCSYNSDQFLDSCKNQTTKYLDWVGKLGQNLTGNPKAKPDENHSAILNLTAVATLTHP